MRFVLVLLFLAGPVAAAEPPSTGDALPLIRAERWEDAAALLERVAAANPYDGPGHYYLGVSYQQLGRCSDALPVLERALDLGVNAGRNGMRAALVAAARCAADLGDNDQALDCLERAWGRWGLRDVASLLAEPRFDTVRGRAGMMTGRTPEADGGDPVARWRADLLWYRNLLERAHPNPFHEVSAAAWRQVADRLDRSIASATDLEITSSFMRLASLIGDGHTAVYPPTEGSGAWHLLPLYPIWLRDGWYVGAAAPELAPAVGARILGAGGVGIDSLVALAGRHLAADNEMTSHWLAGVALQFAEIYRLAGASSDSRTVCIDLELPDGSRRSVTATAGPVTRNPNARWAPTGWPSMFGDTSLWLSHAGEAFRHLRVDGTSAVYAQINQTADTDTLSMAAYGHRLRAFFRESGASTLILDLRLNNGGDANDARGFVDELIRLEALEREGSLFLLIGPRTFSATGYLLGMCEKHLHPVLVGMPTGCRPVDYSSERHFRLPYSGLEGSISCELRTDGRGTDDIRPWFAPDRVIWPTGPDLRAGRDPVLEEALAALR